MAFRILLPGWTAPKLVSMVLPLSQMRFSSWERVVLALPQLALCLQNIRIWSLFPHLYKVLRIPSSLHLWKSRGKTTSLLYAHQQSYAEDSASHLGNKQISSVLPSLALCCWRRNSILLHLVPKNRGSGHNHSALNFIGTSLILVTFFLSRNSWFPIAIEIAMSSMGSCHSRYFRWKD